jgi:GAF domain-containing protein
VTEFDRLLQRIVDGIERGTLTLQEAAHYAGEHVARKLQCSGATLWTLAGPPGLRVLTRIGGFDTTLAMPLTEPLQFTLAGSSAWIETLAERRIFASADVQSDPRLGDDHAPVVGPRRVRGLLQAAIGANAGLWGFVSCTQYDTPRAWTPRETTQLQRIAIALSIRRSRDRAAARARDRARVAPPVPRASTTST